MCGGKAERPHGKGKGGTRCDAVGVKDRGRPQKLTQAAGEGLPGSLRGHSPAAHEPEPGGLTVNS